MIKGKVPVSWSQQDYQNLTFFTKTKEQHNESYDLVKGTGHVVDNGVYICNENIPDVLTNVGNLFDLEKKICVVNRMNPGQVLPFHKDKCLAYIERNKIINIKNITRIIVFLHDQKPGHQLWINDKICMGPAGSYFGWNIDTEHMAANLGYEPRYILQITGLSK